MTPHATGTLRTPDGQHAYWDADHGGTGSGDEVAAALARLLCGDRCRAG